MTWLRVWLSRALELVRRRRRELELEEEIAAHLDFLTDEHLRKGLSPMMMTHRWEVPPKLRVVSAQLRHQDL